VTAEDLVGVRGFGMRRRHARKLVAFALRRAANALNADGGATLAFPTFLLRVYVLGD